MKKFIASQLLSDTDWQKFITSNYDLQPEYHGTNDRSDVTSAAMLHDAITEGMDKEKAEISAITNNTDAPNFDNTIVALTQSGGMLERATATMYNLLSAETNDELDELANKMAQKLSDHENDIMLNEQLFARVKMVYDNERDQLDGEDRKLLDKTYEAFERSGATLNDTTSHASCQNTH